MTPVGLEPAAWHDLFTGTLAASAALLGLFFVAMSLRVNAVEGHPLVRNRALITLAALIGVILMSLEVLIPRQPLVWLGIELIATNLSYALLVGAWTARALRHGAHPRASSWFRVIANYPGVALCCLSGISLIAGTGPGLYLLLPSVLLIVPAATYNAWDVVFAPEIIRRHK